MRCYSRRVNATLASAPLLATAFRPIPLVVMGHLAATWLVAFGWWAFYEMLGPALDHPAYLIMIEGPVAPAGYWWHLILGGLLWADRLLARGDPPGLRWTRRGTWAIAAFALFVSLWNYTLVHRHAQRATTEWHRYHEYFRYGVRNMEETIRRGDVRRGDDSDWAFTQLQRARLARPGEPEVLVWLAWFRLSHPDPVWRDMGRAQALIEEAERTLLVRQRRWYDEDRYADAEWKPDPASEHHDQENQRLHHAVRTALAAMEGDRETALEHVQWICPQPYDEHGYFLDEDEYLQSLEERGYSEEDRRFATLLLEGRPWDAWNQGP